MLYKGARVVCATVLIAAALALLGCEEPTPSAAVPPAAGAPGEREPVPPAAAPAPAGIHAEKYIVAITAGRQAQTSATCTPPPQDEPGPPDPPAPGEPVPEPPGGRSTSPLYAITQHGERIDLTLTFPTQFVYASSPRLPPFHSWDYTIRHDSITQDVLTNGAIIASYSFDDGATWTFGSANEWVFTVTFRYRRGAIILSMDSIYTTGKASVEYDICRTLSGNRMLLRFWMLRNT